MWTSMIYRPSIRRKNMLVRVWQSKPYFDPKPGAENSISGRTLAINAANNSGVTMMPGFRVFVHKSRQE